MKKLYTVDIFKEDDWFIGQIRQIKGGMTQGRTPYEILDNMKEVFFLLDIEPKVYRKSKQIIATPTLHGKETIKFEKEANANLKKVASKSKVLRALKIFKTVEDSRRKNERNK